MGITRLKKASVVAQSNTKSLFQTIRELRLAKGLSQAYLAKQLSISRPTYMLIEQGGRDLTLSEAQILAEIFGLTLEDFIAGKTPPKIEIIIDKKKRVSDKNAITNPSHAPLEPVALRHQR